MLVEWIEWDEHNSLHAGHGVSVSEIEQAIANAIRFTAKPGTDRQIIRSRTNGGRPVTVVLQRLERGGGRPITAWESKG